MEKNLVGVEEVDHHPILSWIPQNQRALVWFLENELDQDFFFDSKVWKFVAVAELDSPLVTVYVY